MKKSGIWGMFFFYFAVMAIYKFEYKLQMFQMLYFLNFLNECTLRKYMLKYLEVTECNVCNTGSGNTRYV